MSEAMSGTRAAEAAADLRLVEELERHSAASWPAPEVTEIGGWELRYTPGSRSRRVNCLTPATFAPDGFDAALETARRICTDRGAPCTVRLQPLAGEASRERVARLGFATGDATSVQLAPLAAGGAVPEGVSLVNGFDAAWVEAMGLAHEDDATERAVVAHLLERAAAGQVLATAFDDGRPAAFGRAVVRGDLAGIFHVVTDKAHRRRGLGRRTVAALMAAAEARGARRAYLQVTVANAEARPLYASLGFREVYVYDYWAG